MHAGRGQHNFFLKGFKVARVDIYRFGAKYVQSWCRVWWLVLEFVLGLIVYIPTRKPFFLYWLLSFICYAVISTLLEYSWTEAHLEKKLFCSVLLWQCTEIFSLYRFLCLLGSMSGEGEGRNGTCSISSMLRSGICLLTEEHWDEFLGSSILPRHQSHSGTQFVNACVFADLCVCACARARVRTCVHAHICISFRIRRISLFIYLQN